MPSKITPQNSLHTFDPRIRAILEQGSVRKIIITGNHAKPAKEEFERLYYLRQRMNTYRYNLNKIDAEAAKILYRALVTVDKEKLELIIQPRDSNVADLLDQFEQGEAQLPPLTMTVPGEEEKSLDELAKELDL